MVQALRLVPDEAAHEPFRQAIRVNLTAWSEQTARLQNAFRLPGKVPAGPYGQKDSRLKWGFIAGADARGTFVTLGPDQNIRQWSFAGGKEVGKPFRIDLNKREDRRPFSVSPDGRWLATSGPAGRVFDLDRGVPVGGPVRHSDVDRPRDYTLLMFTEEPSVLATTSIYPDEAGYYHFFDAKTLRKMPVAIRLGSGDSFRVARNVDGRPLVLVSGRGQGLLSAVTLDIWDLRSGQKCSPPIQIARGPSATSPHPGSFLCVTRADNVRAPKPRNTDGPLCRWDLATGRLAATPWQPPISAWHRFLAANDSVLVTHCRDGRIRLFDLDANRQLGGHVSVPTIHAPDTDPVSLGLAVAADGTSLVTLSRDGTVRCWDVAHLVAQSSRSLHESPSHFASAGQPGKEEKVVALSPGGDAAFFAQANAGRIIGVHEGKDAGGSITQNNLNAAAFSPDGAYLATATLGYNRQVSPVVRIWNAGTGKLHFEFDSPSFVLGFQFSPDSRRLAVARVFGTTLIDVPEKKVLSFFADSTTATNLAFSPDGRRLAVGYRGGWPGVGAGFRLWDVVSGKPASPFQSAWSWWSTSQPLGYTDGGDSLVVLDPDGRKLTCLDLRQKELRRTELDIQSPGNLAATPASPLVAATNATGAIELWDVRTGRRQRTIASGGEVRALHLSPDGRILAAVCADQAVRLHDMETGLPLGPPRHPPSPAAALTYRPGGREIVIATQCGRLIRWPLPEPMTGSPQECEHRLEARLGLTFASGDAVLLTPEAWAERRRLAADAK